MKKKPETAKQIEFLKSIAFFSDFDDHELHQFLTVSTWLKVARGSVIIRENTVEKVFYILVRGEVAVFKEAGGAAVELTRLSTGDCFGEMAILGESRRTAGVMATSDCYILRVEPGIINRSNVFLQLKFYKRFCEIMVSRLDMANRRVAAARKAAGIQEQPAALPPAHDLDAEMAGRPVMPATAVEKPAETSPTPLPERKERITRVRIQGRIDPDQPLPVNPHVARRLAPFLSGRESNIRRFTDIVCLDPVLCFRVLKVANSSLYRRSCEIATVPHAIVSVGMEVVLETVARAVDEGSRLEPFSGDRGLAKKFFRHAVIVARIAELLREIVRMNIAADVYLAGLLHDIGMLALDPLEPAFYANINDPSAGISELNEAEAIHIGADHGAAGQWLCEKSGLGSAWQEAMRHHHNPMAAREHRLLAALIAIANTFAAARGECVGAAALRDHVPENSPGWVVLKRDHPPFAEVAVGDFCRMFETEIEKGWKEIEPDF